MSGGDAGQGARGPTGSVDQGARGAADPYDWQMQQLGQAAIVHHFGCPRRSPLDYDLVENGIAYLCRECDQRVTVGADGQPVTSAQPDPAMARVVVAPAALPTAAAFRKPRKPGRPGWTRTLFYQRYDEARSSASDESDPAIAKKFRGKAADGSAGIEVDSLRRLRRRAETGEMPE